MKSNAKEQNKCNESWEKKKNMNYGLENQESLEMGAWVGFPSIR